MSGENGALRVLVVEDEGIVAMFIEDMLLDMGHVVAATAARLDDARRAAETASFDFAIVDVSLQGEPSYPIAEILRARGIPFVFATGYGAAGLEPGHGAVATLQKPFARDDLQAAMSLVIAPR